MPQVPNNVWLWSKLRTNDMKIIIWETVFIKGILGIFQYFSILTSDIQQGTKRK